MSESFLRGIDGYKLIRTLREGGFSEIFLAKREKELVVIKVPKGDELSRHLLIEEAEILKEVSKPLPHDNIVAFIELIKSIPALVEEYVPGPTLREAFSGRIATQSDAVRIALGCLSALERIHSLGIAHGDVKPENIILPEPLHPVLVDMGVARRFGSKPLAGTMGWSAPELLRGEISPESDIYSVGALLLFMLTGKDPPDDPSSIKIPKNISDSLKYVLERSINPQPWERFGSAREMSLSLMGRRIPQGEGPRLVIQGKVVPVTAKVTLGREKRQGGTGNADICLQELGDRRILPPGPPIGWVEISRVGSEYWISDMGAPGGVWVQEGGTWKKIVDYPLKHGQLISIGLRVRGRMTLPYVLGRFYMR
ncbi:MAG: serine/threonine protein kinase [Candidatus Korarchaeum sp.]|nr:serine/threonine protein kinase [Candidatus Korarchaeum sp.]MDW8034828.1 protein kinase [Candidatus Korarchaeum sp.]